MSNLQGSSEIKETYLNSILYYITDFTEEHLALHQDLFKYCFNFETMDFINNLPRNHLSIIKNILRMMQDTKDHLSRSVKYGYFHQNSTIENRNMYSNRIRLNKDCLNNLNKFITFHSKFSTVNNLLYFISSMLFIFSLDDNRRPGNQYQVPGYESQGWGNGYEYYQSQQFSDPQKSVVHRKNKSSMLYDFIFNETKLNNIYKKIIANKIVDNFMYSSQQSYYSSYSMIIEYIPILKDYININKVDNNHLSLLNKAILDNERTWISTLRDIGTKIDVEESLMNNVYYCFTTNKKLLNSLLYTNENSEYYTYSIYYNIYVVYIVGDNLSGLKSYLNSFKYPRKDQDDSLFYDFLESDKELDEKFLESVYIERHNNTPPFVYNKCLEKSFISNTLIKFEDLNFNVLISEYNTTMIVGCQSVEMLKYLVKNLNVSLNDPYFRIIIHIKESLIPHLFELGYKFNENKYTEYVYNNYILKSEKEDIDFPTKTETIINFKQQYKKNLLNKLKINKNIELSNDILKIIVDFI